MAAKQAAEMRSLHAFLLVAIYIWMQPQRSLARIAAQDLREFEGSLTTFCVDPKAVELFKGRIDSCLGGRSIEDEIDRLLHTSVFHFQKLHELFAYRYFVTNENNPRRMASCANADFEYIPFLPLSWKLEFPVQTWCTAGDVCPRRATSDESCGAARMVKDLLRFIQYVQSERGEDIDKGAQRLIVTSAYNLKTVIGRGMSAAIRKGDEHRLLSAFIESTVLGHYERLTQCADVLRKQWRHVVEIPYVSVIDSLAQLGKPLEVTSPPLRPPNLMRPTKELSYMNGIHFFFSGQILLWGSERVCSVRVAMLQLLTRNDTVVLDISSEQSDGPPFRSKVYYDYLKSSEFCLIARSDSHTTAAFFEAIAANCVPVVISDWFIFSFWWWIPYETFVIRVKEVDFLSNPNAVLNRIKASHNASMVQEMKKRMRMWQKFLSFPMKNSGNVHLPFDMLLIEARKATENLIAWRNNNPQSKFSDVYKDSRNDPILCFNPSTCYPIVKPLEMAPSIEDNRAHLCQHSNRLIGHYKIVYFMQCVRVLWSLRPGLMKPVDVSISADEKSFVYNFHNLSNISAEHLNWDVYPNGLNGNTVDKSIDGSAAVYYLQP